MENLGLSLLVGHSEPAAPISAPSWRMNGKWSGNSFLLGSSSLYNLIEFGAHMLHVHKKGDATKVDQNMSHLDS